MINDRGSIKWTAMMLPEHVERLRQMKKGIDDDYMPEIDEQQLQDMSFKVTHALHNSETVHITYYDAFDHQRLHASGIIKQFNYRTGQLELQNEHEEILFLPIEDFIKIE
jgi:hypothetical protein